MKKSLLIPFFMTAASLHAGFMIEIGPSYRLDWQRVESHIAPSSSLEHGNDQYKNVSIWELDGRIATDFTNPFYVGAEGKYGWVGSGSGNLYEPYFIPAIGQFELLNTTLTGHTYDASVFAGYRFLLTKKFAAIPVGGYEHHEKSFTLNKGQFEFAGVPATITGDRQTNNYLYKDHLRGPFAGMEFEWVLPKNSFFFFGGFHWNWYLATSRATFSWDALTGTVPNTHIFFKSTRHANVQGPSGILGMSYNLNCHTFICLKSTYYYTYLSNGHAITTCFAESVSTTTGDVTSETLETADLRIDEWNWSSWSIQLLVGYDF